MAVANRGGSEVAVSPAWRSPASKAGGVRAGCGEEGRASTPVVRTSCVPKGARLTDARTGPTSTGTPAGPEGRARHLRTGRAVRRAVPAVAVPGDVPAERWAVSEIDRDLPVQYRYVKDIFLGEKRMELNVVPAFSVRTTPATSSSPARGATGCEAGRPRDPRVGDQRRRRPRRRRARSRSRCRLAGGRSSAAATARLRERGRVADDPLHGDRAGRRQGRASTRFARSSPRPATRERTVRERLPGDRLPAHPAPPGDQAGRDDTQGDDVKVTPNIRVGYIVGAGDQVPPAIEQLGAKVDVHRARRTRVGRPVEVRRHRDRRPGLRAAPICAPTTAA